MEQMPDNAQSAKQPQVGSDPEEELFTMMVAAARKHIYGKGEQGISKQLQEADNIGRVTGEIVFTMVRELAKQAESQVPELGMEMLLGVATEIIDDITELMSAYGIELSQDDREDALLYAQQLYVESYQPSDDERNVAKQDLALFKQEGAVDQAVTYVQKRGMENGTDPFGVAQMDGGSDAPAGKPKRPQLMGGE